LLEGESMTGTQVASPRLFYDFCLDDHVPSDHLLRRIDQFLDLESVRAELRPFYSKIGRPSIDPELMMRMLIIGYSRASGLNGGCARKSISISPIAGSAA
jgi:transposase